MNAKSSRAEGPPALDLIEETVHCLRVAPVSMLVTYYAGSLPFVLGFLFYWADMSRSATAHDHAPGAALGITLLFFWMKAWQSVFAGQLRARVAGRPPPRWTIRGMMRLAVTQSCFHAAGLFLLPISLVLTIPFGWAYATFQNLTVLGEGEEKGLRATTSRAYRLAALWPGQNHLLLAILSVFGLFVLLNLFSALLFGPQLLKMFLGIDTLFTRSPFAFFNSTLFATVFALAYLCVDPLVKAIYVLRCFHGDSVQSGEDLRAELKSITTARPIAAIATLAAVLLCGGRCEAAAPHESAPAASAPVVQVVPAELEQSIREVLSQSEYQWRLPRREVAAPQEDGFAQRAVKTVFGWLKWVGHKIGDALDWLDRMLRPKGSANPGADGSSVNWMMAVRTLLFLVLAVLAAVLGVFLYRVWQRRNASQAVAARAIPLMPDLTDERTGADQLPEDGWLDLARQCLERGELRLALRALYLASLAHLAARELVVLARFKSNRDYERELRRRAHASADLNAAFGTNVTIFDGVWYGPHDPTPDLYAEFSANLERIRAC